MLWALGLLVLGQGLLSLWSARRWLAFIREHFAAELEAPVSSAPPDDFLPPLTLIVPCRGHEAGLEENLAAYRSQFYPDYELILVTTDPSDPASAAAGSVPGARLIHAAPRADEGEKVTKLRAAVRQVRPVSRVLVFADSDGRPHRTWLRELVRPLSRSEQDVGATTGYRWYLPPRTNSRVRLPAVLRAVWDSFIASLLGDHDGVFCWGGSTALRRETFVRLDIDSHWQGSVSDDYRLTAALREAGLPVRFVPACLVANHSDCAWRELLSWTTRQIIITRVYAPWLWKLGLGANLLYCAGLATLLGKLPSLWAAGLLAAIALASVATGLTRAAGAAAALPAHRTEIQALRWAFGLLAPLTPLLMLYNFVAAGLTSTIHWRGTSYQLRGPQQTRVIRRTQPFQPTVLKATAPGSGAGEDA